MKTAGQRRALATLRSAEMKYTVRQGDHVIKLSELRRPRLSALATRSRSD